MTQLAILDAILSPVHDAAAIGYFVKDSTGSTTIAFTTTDVSLSYSGRWEVAGQVGLPEDGGRVYFGISTAPGDIYASVNFQPKPDDAADVVNALLVVADDFKADVSGLPTASEIDTELTSSHGAGSWVKAIAEFVDACCRRTWSVWDSGR